MVQTALQAIELSPIECKQDLLGESGMLNGLKAIGSAKDLATIEDLDETVQQWTQAISQLTNSITVSARTLNGKMKAQKAMGDRMVADHKRDSAKKQIEVVQQQETEARKLLQKAKTSAFFEVSWESAGHPKIKTVSEEELTKGSATLDDFDVPRIIAPFPMIEKLFEEGTTGEHLSACNRFLSEFEKKYKGGERTSQTYHFPSI
jgi:hypothetical protein